LNKADDAARVELALRRTRFSTLGLLAVCAAVIASQPEAPEPVPDRLYTVLAVSAGLGTILFRRFSLSPVIQPRSAVILSLISLVCACALGCVGVLVALNTGAKQSGLLYTLVAALFSLRGLMPTPSPSAATPRGKGD
jgi:hypothetical protein